MEGYKEPQEYVLSEREYPIRVVARPHDIKLDDSCAEPVPLGYLEFEEGYADATVYFSKEGSQYTSFATLTFNNDSSEEVRTLFTSLGQCLSEIDKAKAISRELYELPASAGFVNYMRFEEGEDVILIYPREPGGGKDPLTPLHFAEGSGYSAGSLIMDVGKSVSEVVNHLHFMGKDRAEPSQYSMDIYLPAEPLAAARKQSTEPLPRHAGFPSFEDFGGLDSEIAQLRAVVRDMQTPLELFEEYGLERPHGIVLTGPGGVGKTELTKALAKEMQAEFRYLQVSDVMSKWVGESSKRLRYEFEQARSSDNNVILFCDEFDGLFSENAGGNSGAARALIAEFKALLSEANAYPNVLVVAAANSLEGFDPALLRPGRFDVHIKIQKPDEAARAAIFGKYICAREIHYEMPSLEDTGHSVDVQQLASLSEDLTGADIKHILQGLLRAKMHAELESGQRPPRIGQNQIEAAISAFRRSRVAEA